MIEEVESKVEGDIDLRRFLGTDKSVRNGFQNIRMSFDICADEAVDPTEEVARISPSSRANAVPIRRNNRPRSPWESPSTEIRHGDIQVGSDSAGRP